jgi:hypothetical protein
MGISLRLILMILAIVSLAMAAAGVQTTRANLLALGLALWALATIVTV